ncbi:MAG: V-type ATPase 116kDa subunit family protein, partial [Candidatus Nezhaarchaeales archaeon]
GLSDGLSESLDNFIASLSNTISYARLFAFALVHAVLSHVFLSIDEGLYAMIGVPFIGAIAGTIFFVFFEIIFVFFQALRLHWVEHGTKFLITNGTPFQPFAISLKPVKL